MLPISMVSMRANSVSTWASSGTGMSRGMSLGGCALATGGMASYARWSCKGKLAGAGDAMTSCLTNSGGWTFTGGSVSAPDDMMEARDMGSARGGGGGGGCLHISD